ncbi:MAG: hypothetical protein WC842_01025 [Candidatus Paceibacterota bacterium]|jgi:hypothetical protein
MTETIIGLTGVIIGGLIGIIVQIISSRSDLKKWQKERIIESLRNKRESLDRKTKEYKEKLIDGMENGTYEAEMCFDFLYLFPQNVCSAFDLLINEKDPKKRRDFYHNVISEMKQALLDIDKKIELEIYKK